MAEEIHGGITFIRFGGKRVAEIENFRYTRRSITRKRHPLGEHQPVEIVRMAEEPVQISFDMVQLLTPSAELEKVYPKTEVSSDFFSLPALKIVVEEELTGKVLAVAEGFRAIEEVGEYVIEDYTRLRFQGEATRFSRY